MAGVKSVEEFRIGLTPGDLAIVDRLRALASGTETAVEERIKWKAPSFAKDGIDRITLGLNRGGGVRVVLHRGAKIKATDGFEFVAPDDLVQWPAADRGVMTFVAEDDVLKRESEIEDVFRRWLETD